MITKQEEFLKDLEWLFKKYDVRISDNLAWTWLGEQEIQVPQGLRFSGTDIDIMISENIFEMEK